MDVNELRSLSTLFMFLAFLCIVVWAWRSSRRAGFDAAAQLPLVDEAPAAPTQGERP